MSNNFKVTASFISGQTFEDDNYTENKYSFNIDWKEWYVYITTFEDTDEQEYTFKLHTDNEYEELNTDEENSILDYIEINNL